MYIDQLITPATLGKRKRLNRILGANGKGVIVPLDDSLISCNNEGLRNLKKKLRPHETLRYKTPQQKEDEFTRAATPFENL